MLKIENVRYSTALYSTVRYVRCTFVDMLSMWGRCPFCKTQHMALDCGATSAVKNQMNISVLTVTCQTTDLISPQLSLMIVMIYFVIRVLLQTVCTLFSHHTDWAACSNGELELEFKCTSDMQCWEKCAKLRLQNLSIYSILSPRRI